MVLLEVRDLHKGFKSVKAVNGVSFQVNEGEVFGLLGPNGAGKSTTISIISGLVTPDTGEILLRNKNVTKNLKEIKRILGFVPQDIALYPTLTARENLNFWGKMYGLKGKDLKRRINEVLEYVGLAERSNDRIDTYSGGMKRRINIAVALLHKPSLLIMDEPTVGIDPQSRAHILGTVKRLNNEGMTVIYTSHYMEEVEYLCHRIAIMDYGRVIALGQTEDLKKMVGNADRIEVLVRKAGRGALEKIRSIEGVEEVSQAEGSITILVKNAREKLASILKILTGTDSGVKSVNIEEPNLESVFLHLTGRALRD